MREVSKMAVAFWKLEEAFVNRFAGKVMRDRMARSLCPCLC